MVESGGFFNIGIVFRDDGSIKEKTVRLCNFFTSKGSVLTSLKYATDEEGRHWVEKNIQNNCVDVNALEGFYVSISMTGDAFGIVSKDVFFTVEKREDCCGFLINIRWSDFFDETETTETLLKKSDGIEKLLTELFLFEMYEYVIVGCELEIEISPESLKKMVQNEHDFPLVLLNVDGNLQVLKGVYGIDGITQV